MDRVYDVFEVTKDGLIWRCSVTGLLQARAKIEELAKASTNEFYAMHLPSREIVARAKNPS